MVICVEDRIWTWKHKHYNSSIVFETWFLCVWCYMNFNCATFVSQCTTYLVVDCYIQFLISQSKQKIKIFISGTEFVITMKLTGKILYIKLQPIRQPYPVLYQSLLKILNHFQNLYELQPVDLVLALHLFLSTTTKNFTDYKIVQFFK